MVTAPVKSLAVPESVNRPAPDFVRAPAPLMMPLSVKMSPVPMLKVAANVLAIEIALAMVGLPTALIDELAVTASEPVPKAELLPRARVPALRVVPPV